MGRRRRELESNRDRLNVGKSALAEGQKPLYINIADIGLESLCGSLGVVETTVGEEWRNVG